ncbi:alpha-D-ribose 1-methylphosphonate 5-triphosphate diphosphatase [soil metagenome]
MSQSFALRHVRAVLADRILEDATVVVDGDGRIESIAERGSAPPAAVDGGGAYCFAGLIDTHSDGLEKELRPRPNVELPVDFALRSFEGRLRSSGVTTVFHGVGFQSKVNTDRSIAQAHRCCDAIVERRRLPGSPVEHRVLHRVEARSTDGLDAMTARLADDEVGAAVASSRPLVSFEDHTPGQGQFRDVEQFRRYLDAERLEGGIDADTYVARRMAEGEALAPLRAEKLTELTVLARSGRIRLLGHDLEDAAQVAEADEAWGASVAEFPLSIEAATEARRRGMPVVMGAPNVLRGSSHSGNVAAAELVALGLCDVLASDYLPSTLLAAVFTLVANGISTLPAAVGLVTSGPADLAGLDDRGRLEPGARADLTLVALDGRWPRVTGTWRATGTTFAGAAV